MTPLEHDQYQQLRPPAAMLKVCLWPACLAVPSLDCWVDLPAAARVASAGPAEAQRQPITYGMPAA